MLAPGRRDTPPPRPGQARTVLRSGACGLEGLTGTESPAADGMYKTGPGWVGLDTAEEGCRSSLRAGSTRDSGRCQQAPEPEMHLGLSQRTTHIPNVREGGYLIAVTMVTLSALSTH